MKKILCISLIFTGITACTSQDIDRDIAKLKSEAKTALTRLEALDSAAVYGSFSRIEPHFKKLGSMEFDSSLKEVYTHDLTWMDRYNRGIYKWFSQRDKVKERLEFCIRQLDNLAYDSKNGELDSAAVRQYLNQEQQLVTRALDVVEGRGGEMEYYARGVDSMVVRMDSIFNSLQ